ncbi:hypothetical protein ACFPK9_01955 [Rubritalea spongiae]|uniref:Lipoprotein n=1 Tax=Rubritalea spongiae TaxID=430797 RepID=A0ABW5E3E9_9BACT
MLKHWVSLGGVALLSSCASQFPGEPNSAVSEYSEGERHRHGMDMQHAHRVEAYDRAHFHPNKNWEVTRTVAEEKKRRLDRYYDQRRMSMVMRPRRVRH